MKESREQTSCGSRLNLASLDGYQFYPGAAFPQSASIWDGDIACDSGLMNIGNIAKKSKKNPTGFSSPDPPEGEGRVNPSRTESVPRVSNTIMASVLSQLVPGESAPPPVLQLQQELKLPSHAVLAQQAIAHHNPVLVASTGQDTSAVVMQDSLSSQLHTMIQRHDSHGAASHAPSAPFPEDLKENSTRTVRNSDPVSVGRISHSSRTIHAAALASRKNNMEQLFSDNWEKDIEEMFANDPHEPRRLQSLAKPLQKSSQSEAVPPPRFSLPVPAPTTTCTRSSEPPYPSLLANFFASQGLQDETSNKKNASIPLTVATCTAQPSTPISDFFASTSSMSAPSTGADSPYPSLLASFLASQGVQDESNTKKNADTPSPNGQKAPFLSETDPDTSAIISEATKKASASMKNSTSQTANNVNHNANITSSIGKKAFFLHEANPSVPVGDATKKDSPISSMSAPATSADPPFPSLLASFFASQGVQDETNSKKSADIPSPNGQKATILAETKKKSVQCSVVPKRRGKVEVIDPKTQRSTTPQEYFNSILSSRGYSTKVYSSLDCGYHSKPSPLQIASFGTEVLQAVEKNNAPKLSKLLRSGLSRNPCSSFSDGTLARAIKRGHFEAFRAQLEAGAAVHVVDDFGRTPLHYAAWAAKTCFKTVEAILEVDASMLRVSDNQGGTPLDYLTSRNAQGWVEFVERIKDKYWPDRGVGWEKAEAMPKAVRAGDTLPDPDDALHVDVARMVAAGQIDRDNLESMKASSVSTVKKASGEKLQPLPAAKEMSTNKRKLDDFNQIQADTLHVSRNHSAPKAA